ncbi:hypothetical protein [Ralstonia phage RP13]|nr:hypothetical protein [Ralstonia phage RP13]
MNLTELNEKYAVRLNSGLLTVLNQLEVIIYIDFCMNEVPLTSPLPYPPVRVEQQVYIPYDMVQYKRFVNIWNMYKKLLVQSMDDSFTHRRIDSLLSNVKNWGIFSDIMEAMIQDIENATS